MGVALAAGEAAARPGCGEAEYAKTRQSTSDNVATSTVTARTVVLQYLPPDHSGNTTVPTTHYNCTCKQSRRRAGVKASLECAPEVRKATPLGTCMGIGLEA